MEIVSYITSLFLFSSGATTMSSGSFGNAKQNQVMKMINGCAREEGMSREVLVKQLEGKVGKADVDAALDFLSSEGHIYSTIDDDHFKAIDS